MKKILFLAMVALMVAVLAACGSDTEETEEGTAGAEQQTITFGVTPWTSTVPPTKIAGLILQDMGYEVVETNADAGSVYTGLSRGDLDVFMDAWVPMHQNYLDKYEGDIESTSVSYPEAETGWTVPTYMEDINSLEDLEGREGEFDNEFYGIEAGAGATIESDEIIEAYGFDMTQVSSSEGGMLAQAQKLMAQEEPVIFYGWRPHTMFNKFDLKVLTNEEGFFETSSVEVITNTELKDNAPEAYEFLSNWSISLDDVEEMIVKIEEGGEPEEVAQEWIDNNQDKVDEMTGE
ncbi:glycine betaine/proline transport system substrate-binding protein [Planomicrobium stackebrandtii]|uniref:Glycine betaine/proline transport system substrate-binding protein n=1 Tax=Planomicrobium stackebrandtii TaxID=253160 RepID=A0ABU0GRK4_9BACL|nr:glycine betaine ABC transporter substrate-binding protein [Planomicrobium stackebrandtii]MDQ0427983.1 glycine betaine/proline transport system substrate-binding protein [Planomicrobium stackebrandtii]